MVLAIKKLARDNEMVVFLPVFFMVNFFCLLECNKFCICNRYVGIVGYFLVFFRIEEC